MNKRKTITICSSASFYDKVFKIKERLEKLGFKVKVPITANKMKKTGDFNVDHYKTWFKNFKDYAIKTKLMKDHFKKVLEGDAILVLNYEKHGINGYIGANVLIEMAIAFQNKKPIFILNAVPSNLPNIEEILGLCPKILNGDLSKIQ